jgi:hypothetical protein
MATYFNRASFQFRYTLSSSFWLRTYGVKISLLLALERPCAKRREVKSFIYCQITQLAFARAAFLLVCGCGTPSV